MGRGKFCLCRVVGSEEGGGYLPVYNENQGQTFIDWFNQNLKKKNFFILHYLDLKLVLFSLLYNSQSTKL